MLKVWIDDAILVELLTPAMVPAYVETFGTLGLPALDDKLRDLEKPPASQA